MVDTPEPERHVEEPLDRIGILFSDFFGVLPQVVEDYGAFNISLVGDLPLFIDPFLLFNSKDEKYQALHEGMIRYLVFLRDKSVEGAITPGLLKAWFFFQEVKETWLGFSASGNRGSGLGLLFATALNANFQRIFGDGEQVTRGKHLEKLCLIRDRVGRDYISDFTTNLIKGYLAEFTQGFASDHLSPDVCDTFRVNRVRFNYDTESWEAGEYLLPRLGDSYILLVPTDMLTRDDTWINKSDLYSQFRRIPQAIDDSALREQIDNYFRKLLPRRPNAEDVGKAIRETITEFPVIVDYFIKMKEDEGERAEHTSRDRVDHATDLYLEKFKALAELLARQTAFYETPGNSYEEAMERVMHLKQVIENNDGYRYFYDKDGSPVRREEDLHIAYRLTWFGTKRDVNAEVNNGRGPVDFKISAGAKDKVLVEFKLASNSQLKRNLENQVAIYEKANQTRQSIKVILFFDRFEEHKVTRVLKELKLADSPHIVLIDARRDNKPSASKA